MADLSDKVWSAADRHLRTVPIKDRNGDAGDFPAVPGYFGERQLPAASDIPGATVAADR